jgi:hypothetical protein
MFEPFFEIMVQAPFVVVDKDGRGDVHGVAENQPFLDSGPLQNVFHLGRNVYKPKLGRQLKRQILGRRFHGRAEVESAESDDERRSPQVARFLPRLVRRAAAVVLAFFLPLAERTFLEPARVVEARAVIFFELFWLERFSAVCRSAPTFFRVRLGSASDFLAGGAMVALAVFFTEEILVEAVEEFAGGFVLEAMR